MTTTTAIIDDAPTADPGRPRRTVPRRTRVDFWLDLALLIGFVLDYSFQFTGLTVHEWIGLGLALPLLVHLTLHWDWVVRTTKRLVRRRGGRESVRWVVDLALMGAMTLCIASGVLISQRAVPALGLTIRPNGFWTGLHTTTADVVVAATALHVALSWRWIMSVGRRVVVRAR